MTITLSKERKDRSLPPYSRTSPDNVSGPKPTTTKSRALDITYQSKLNPSKTLPKNLLNPTPPLNPNPTTRNSSNWSPRSSSNLSSPYSKKFPQQPKSRESSTCSWKMTGTGSGIRSIPSRRSWMCQGRERIRLWRVLRIRREKWHLWRNRGNCWRIGLIIEVG